MRMKVRGAQKCQQNHTCDQNVLMWTVVVTNLLAFQVLLSPYALATSVSPPSGVSAPTGNTSTQEPSTAGGQSIHRTTAEPYTETNELVINSSTSANVVTTGYFDNYSTTSPQPLSRNITTPMSTDSAVTSIELSEMPTSETDKITALSNQTEPPDFTNLTTLHSTTKSFTDLTTGLTETSTTADQTSEISTLTTILQTTSLAETSPTSTTQVNTSSITPTVIISTTLKPSETSSPLIPTITPSQSIPTQTPELTSQNLQSSTSIPSASTKTLYDTTQPTSLLVTVTTGTSPDGSLSLTTQQWIGIGVAIGVVVALLVIALCLLVWFRTRNNLLSKKPSIKVSKEEYSRSSTLALKDPQWRKSLNMALQSMNTHIELPKETDEEMQAVDNLAYIDESHDPQTSNQDPSHLTKV